MRHVLDLQDAVNMRLHNVQVRLESKFLVCICAVDEAVSGDQMLGVGSYSPNSATVTEPLIRYTRHMPL